MNPELVHAHIAAQAHLRAVVKQAIAQIWGQLPGYDRTDVPRFTGTVVPLVKGAQRNSVSLTNAYLARALGRAPLGVNAAQLVGAAVRNGTAPEEVYTRPFITLWSALKEGKPFVDAASAGLARAQGAAAMDIQLSMRDTLTAVGQADSQIMGYQRVADGGACDFCQEVDGAQFQTDDPMPLHNNCGCGVEPVQYTRGQSFTPTPTPDTVAVHDHGELGPMLADPGQHFTSESQI